MGADIRWWGVTGELHSSQLICQQQLLTSLSITAVLGSVVLMFKYEGKTIPETKMTVLHTSPPLNSRCKRRTISGVPKDCHCMMIASSWTAAWKGALCRSEANGFM